MATSEQIGLWLGHADKLSRLYYLRRLFMEMYKAWKEGRADKDPSEGWYNGELGMFSFWRSL